jgi:hypothetical protein
MTDRIDLTDRIDERTADASDDIEAVAAFVRVLAWPLGRAIAGELRRDLSALLPTAGEGSADQARVDELRGQLDAMQRRAEAAESGRRQAEQERAVLQERYEEMVKDHAAARLQLAAYRQRQAAAADDDGARRLLTAAADRDEQRDEDPCCGNCYYRVEGVCTQHANPRRGRPAESDGVCDKHAYKPPMISRTMPADLVEANRSSLRRTCQSCLHWNGEICRNEHPQAKHGLHVGAGNSCSQHVPRTGEFAPAKSARRQGSRPRATCPDCGGSFPLSARGLLPHDQHGVTYTGGRGDLKRKCPGSGKTPGGTGQAE